MAAEGVADDGVVAETLFLGTSAVCDENKAYVIVFLVAKNEGERSVEAHVDASVRGDRAFGREEREGGGKPGGGRRRGRRRQ